MKNSYLFVAVLVVMMTSSCKKYLDINKNPNAAERVEADLLFVTSTVQYATKRTDGDLWIPMALAGQTVASGGDNEESWMSGYEEQYVFDPLIYGNTWSQLYTVVGVNLRQGITLSESAIPVNNNAAAQCKVLLAMDMYDLATIYGDIPFSEALKTEVLYPKFDAQQQVFEGILHLLDEALAQFDASSPLKISTNDLFYSGDIAKWMKLARSVKLRTLMLMVDKDPSKASAIGQLVTEGEMIGSADDNAAIAFPDVPGRQNPKFAFVNQSFGTYPNGDPLNPFFAAKRTVDFMNGMNDPRLPYFFIKPEGQPDFAGIENGETGDDAIHSRLSCLKLQRADAPEYFFTSQEQLFFEAEVYARGLGVTADLATADARLRSAAMASAKLYGASDNEAEGFGNVLPELSTLGAVEATRYIQMHHWVDEMDRPLDAFTQWRRSGPEGEETPLLTLPLGAPSGGLFRRYEYPQVEEILANPNAPKERIQYDVKMWFDL